MSAVSEPEVYRLLGVWANAFTRDGFLETIGNCRTGIHSIIIGNHNLHSIYLYHHDPKMKYFYDRAAAHVFIDGMPIILWGWLMGYPLRPSHRFTGVDWFFPFMARAAKEGWRVFYLGNRPGIAETGAQRFRAQHPDLLIKTQHGFFEPGKETDAVIAQINAYAPDVLLVGMGMPRQEHWILDYHAQLQVKCIITVGATMDYFAGAIPIPPRWMGQVGLEWLARLWAEPRRLARRYLIEPWSLLPYMVADVRQRLKR